MGTEQFKNILKDLRIEKGVKQKEIARSCDVSPQCISQLELGTRSPTGSTLIALADYFNCSVDYLLGRSEDFAYPDREPYFKQTPLSKQEKELLTNFQTLPPELKEHLSNYAQKLKQLYQNQIR